MSSQGTVSTERPMVEEIIQHVGHYIRARFCVKADDRYFTPEVNLWEEGYIDSVGAVEMIAYLEQTFDIQLPQEVLFDPDFTHVRGIGRLVMQTLENNAR
jgi:acyl carrier protein